MIAVSDAVLILVSAAALASGLYRWQNNLEQASLSNSRPTVAVETSAQDNVATDAASEQIGSSNSTTGNVPASTNVQDTATTQSSNKILVVEPAPTVNINVADDPATNASNNAVVDSTAYGSYIVRPGDSLSEIAERRSTTVRRLQEINQLSNTLITVGQELRYPLPAN